MKQNKKKQTRWFTVVLLSLLSLLLAGGCKIGSKQDAPTEPEVEFRTQEIVLGESNAQESLNELNQSVAPLGDGGFVVVWEEGIWPERDVLMQVVTAQGVPRLDSKQMRIASSWADESKGVVVASPNGGFFVAYCHFEHHYGTRIMVRAYDKNLKDIWNKAIGVAPQIRYWESQNEPNLVADPWGGVYVSYQSFSFGLYYQIICQHLDNSGSRLWGERALPVSRQEGFITYPKAVLDHQGGLYVFWKNFRNPFAEIPEPKLLEGQHLNAAGEKLWGEDRKVIRIMALPSVNYYTFYEFIAVSDGLGGTVVVFKEDLEPGDENMNVVAQRIDYDGTALWGDGVILGNISDDNFIDQVIPARDGGVFVSVNTYPSESSCSLSMFRLAGDGQHLWGPEGVLLSHPDEIRVDYNVYGHFNGNYLHICWTHQQVEDNDLDIKMARLNTDGTMMDPPGGFILSDTGDKMFSRGLAYNHLSNRYFVLWEDSRRSLSWDDFDIYGNIVEDNVYTGFSESSDSPAPIPLSTGAGIYRPAPAGTGIINMNPKAPYPLPGRKIVRYFIPLLN